MYCKANKRIRRLNKLRKQNQKSERLIRASRDTKTLLLFVSLANKCCVVFCFVTILIVCPHFGALLEGAWPSVLSSDTLQKESVKHLFQSFLHFLFCRKCQLKCTFKVNQTNNPNLKEYI